MEGQKPEHGGHQVQALEQWFLRTDRKSPGLQLREEIWFRACLSHHHRSRDASAGRLTCTHNSHRFRAKLAYRGILVYHKRGYTRLPSFALLQNHRLKNIFSSHLVNSYKEKVDCRLRISKPIDQRGQNSKMGPGLRQGGSDGGIASPLDTEYDWISMPRMGFVLSSLIRQRNNS